MMNLAVMKQYPILLGGLFGMVFWVKVLLLVYLQLVLRWTLPRFRYDQIQKLGWQILLPTGLANLFISARAHPLGSVAARPGPVRLPGHRRGGLPHPHPAPPGAPGAGGR